MCRMCPAEGPTVVGSKQVVCATSKLTDNRVKQAAHNAMSDRCRCIPATQLMTHVYLKLRSSAQGNQHLSISHQVTRLHNPTCTSSLTGPGSSVGSYVTLGLGQKSRHKPLAHQLWQGTCNGLLHPASRFYPDPLLCDMQWGLGARSSVQCWNRAVLYS